MPRNRVQQHVTRMDGVDPDAGRAVPHGRGFGVDPHRPLGRMIAGMAAGALCGCRLSATGADIRGDPFGIASQDVGNDDFGAFDREQASLRLTHAMSTAGDNRDFILQTHRDPRFVCADYSRVARSSPGAKKIR